MPKESWPLTYSKLLYKLGQDFLERQYKTQEIEKNHTEGVGAVRGALEHFTAKSVLLGRIQQRSKLISIKYIQCVPEKGGR